MFSSRIDTLLLSGVKFWAMPLRIIRAVLLVLPVVVTGLYVGATTCVSNKKFKVKAVCGIVTDPTGVPIPDVDVELEDVQSVVLQHVGTGEDGRFDMPNVRKGEYSVRVKSKYFVQAWQSFVLTKSNAKGRCRPMLVRLELAGRCSFVSKPK